MDRLQRSEVSETAMVDNFEEPKQPRASEDVDHGEETNMISRVETSSFAARLRMIILLSLVSWALVIAAVAWIAA